jgi:hypothetical protein
MEPEGSLLCSQEPVSGPCHEPVIERFNFKKPNDVIVKEQCQIKISYRFAPLEHLDINTAWEDIKGLPHKESRLLWAETP